MDIFKVYQIEPNKFRNVEKFVSSSIHTNLTFKISNNLKFKLSSPTQDLFKYSCLLKSWTIFKVNYSVKVSGDLIKHAFGGGTFQIDFMNVLKRNIKSITHKTTPKCIGRN